MNALDTKEKQIDDMTMEVARLLHPLISPYDLSESNLIANYRNNPYFNRCVKNIVHLLYDNRRNS